MNYIISFKLDVKLKFNNNNILILNTILNQYSIAIYLILNNFNYQYNYQCNLYYQYKYD